MQLRTHCCCSGYYALTRGLSLLRQRKVDESGCVKEIDHISTVCCIVANYSSKLNFCGSEKLVGSVIGWVKWSLLWDCSENMTEPVVTWNLDWGWRTYCLKTCVVSVRRPQVPANQWPEALVPCLMDQPVHRISLRNFMSCQLTSSRTRDLT